jgi:hypothetical protein
MGVGRTGDGALGLVAVRLLLLVALLLGGCSSVSQISAVVTGGITGAATGSPAVGFAVGVATDAAANYVVRTVSRVRQGAEQDAIAQVAGELPVGAEANWKIEHTIPIGNEHGQLRVIRAIDSPLAACREIAFSVDDGKQRSWFTTDICKQDSAWKWASAEPAVPRWGYLQ